MLQKIERFCWWLEKKLLETVEDLSHVCGWRVNIVYKLKKLPLINKIGTRRKGYNYKTPQIYVDGHYSLPIITQYQRNYLPF